MSETEDDKRRREEEERGRRRREEATEEAIDKKKMLARMLAERRVAYRERRTALLVGPEAAPRSERGLRTDGQTDVRLFDDTPRGRKERERVEEREDRETFQKVLQCLDRVSSPDWHVERGCTEPLVKMANLLASMNMFASDGSPVKADLVRVSTLLQRWDERMPVIPRTERCTELGLDPADPIHKKWSALIGELST